MDVTKRRRYDSTLEFNEDMPKSFNSEKDDFYQLFGPFFERNSYWSKRSPVPQLGTDATDIAKVLKFYQFWDGFDSWREFRHDDEYDVDQAEGRYEKRYMEKENRRMKAPLYKKEKARIVGLVTLAYDNDPRIQKMLKDKEEEREKAKEAKKLAKDQRKQEELDRKQRYKDEETMKRKEAEDQVQRGKDIKLQQRLERQKLQGEIKTTFLAKLKKGKFDEFYLDTVFEKVKKEGQETLRDELHAGAFGSAEEFDSRVKAIVEGIKIVNQETYVKLEATKPDEKREWTTEELSMLAKGLVKFPPGTSNRWTRVSAYLAGDFTENQIAEKAKEMKENPINKQKEDKGTYKVDTGPTPIKDDKWSQPQQKQLEAAIKVVQSTLPPKERWSKIAEMVEGKTIEECVKRFKEIKEKLTQKKKQA